MATWSAEIKELEKIYESLKGQLPEVENELVRLIKSDDENIILLYSRRCLEVIITDLCKCELERPRKTEPLKGIIDKLHKEEKVPSHIITSMHGLNELSTYGAHPKDFDPEQVKPVLNNLAIIIKWYLKYKDIILTDIKAKQPDEIKHEIKITDDIKNNHQFPGRRLTGIILAVLLLIVIVIAGLLFTDVIGSREKSKNIEKSIAVLPFKMLSDEPDKQYLADGMMDAITLHLSKIWDLRVMSTTSVEQYRATTKTTRVIGEELDVEYILEGSFQKFGEDTKLIVQLIKASEGSHVWADEYNSKWSDVFSLQSEVARKIASELMVALTPEEAEMMEERPTDNLEAYQAYLRGKYYASQPHFTSSNWGLAMQNFQEAVEMDTTFALAYGELAHAHARMIYLRQDMSEARFKMAATAAEKALRLGEGQAKVHLALGYYYLYAYRDTEKALMHLEKAEKGLPGNVDIMIEKADIIVTLGRWEEFIRLLERAEKLSPNDAGIPSELALGYWYTRSYSKAIDACNRAIALAPSTNWPYLYKIFSYWSWKGACKESREAIQFINKKHEWYLFTLCWQTVFEDNFKEALQLISDTARIWQTNTKMWAVPKSMFKAVIYDHLNEPDLAREGYVDAAVLLEMKISEVPADPRYHSSLGIVYAGLGRKEEAIREGLKAVELLPVSEDAVYSIPFLCDLTVTYAKTGENDLALETLEQLLSIPSWMSPVWAEMDFRLASIKSLPGYKKLMIKYAVEE